MQQHGSKRFACRPPPLPITAGDGVKRSKFNLLEHSNVAYQIYWNHKMQQHGSKCFAGRPPPNSRRGWGLKVLFQSMVILHINFIGITKLSNMVANIVSADPLPSPYSTVKMSKFNVFRTMSCCISKLRESRNAATW